MTPLTNATRSAPSGTVVAVDATNGDLCATCEGRKVEVIGGLEYTCEGCQGFGTDPATRPVTARLSKLGPARRGRHDSTVDLDARRRTKVATRLAGWLERFDVRTPDDVDGLSEREWAMSATAVGLDATPDERLRAAVADAFRVTAGVS